MRCEYHGYHTSRHPLTLREHFYLLCTAGTEGKQQQQERVLPFHLSLNFARFVAIAVRAYFEVYVYCLRNGQGLHADPRLYRTCTHIHIHRGVSMQCRMQCVDSVDGRGGVFFVCFLFCVFVARTLLPSVGIRVLVRST